MRRCLHLAICTTLWADAACAQSPDALRRSSATDAVLVAPSHLDGDSLVARADSLVRAGHPWPATALLAGRLRGPETASPETRLVGARAAAGWEGWNEVDRLLRNATWLDTRFGGEGRELLVRSALEQGHDALPDARLALGDATTDGARVERGILLARAYDRANQRDSAAAAYAAGAARLPTVADWLRLRAAGVMADSGARAQSFARLSNPTARARIPSTDAQARERTGDFAGAARVYRSVGAEGSAFRVEALAARDDSAKAALARRIIAYLAGRPTPTEVRQTIDVLDKMNVALSPAQSLTVARAAAEHGTAARAVSAFERAGVPSLVPHDRFAYAGALMRAGRARDAAGQYAAISGDSTLVALASYQRARALLQAGDGAGARAALRQTAATYQGVRDAAAPALLLLADLQMDDGDVAGAQSSLGTLTRRFPDAPQAPLALFRSGLIAWNSDPRRAAVLFDSLAKHYPSDDEAVAARYWAARSEDRVGARTDAERRWREIIATSPLSYYAQLSAKRLGTSAWTPPAGPDAVAPGADVAATVARAALLDRLGMDVESRFELDALGERAGQHPTEAAAIAQALVAGGQPWRGLRVASKALEASPPVPPPSRALLRAAYPLVQSDALKEQARRNGLDPALVAGLIRQESGFNPRAVSVAGARGLMQLMPTVGAGIASARGYPLWNQALLFDPDVSMELGTAHLATTLGAGTPVARGLAAYNAGASRVARWSQRPGADDPELFAEWIPFAETRDYVRVVQRNAQIYRGLYPLR